MTAKQAKALADQIRELHGAYAKEFCQRMIVHFARERRPAVAFAWRRLLGLLAASEATLKERGFFGQEQATPRGTNRKRYG